MSNRLRNSLIGINIVGFVVNLVFYVIVGHIFNLLTAAFALGVAIWISQVGYND